MNQKLYIILMIQNMVFQKIYNKKIEKYIDDFFITRKLLINIVEKIYNYQDKRIDNIFTFKNTT